MVQINFAQKTVNVKIVYYGPGMSGKTTNLEVVHQRAPEVNRGDLTSISTDGDRTLFFDYMPLDLGTVAGMRTCFQLYTVPGQVYYNSTRKLVLQGVDGVIFIADSSASMVEQNLESLRNLEENLNEYGKSLASVPHVIQFNKRDLPDAMDVEELNRLLNQHGVPTFDGVANTGQGVFPTLKGLAASVLKTIMQEAGGKRVGAPQPAAAPVPPAPMPTGQAPAPAPAHAAAPAARQGAPAAQPGTREGVPSYSAPASPPAETPWASSPAGEATAPSAPAARPLDTVQVPPRNAPPPTRPPTSAQTPRPTSRTRPPARATAGTRPATKARRTKAATETISAPRPKGAGLFTGLFVVVAAAAGAAIAWVVLRVL